MQHALAYAARRAARVAIVGTVVMLTAPVAFAAWNLIIR